MLFKEIIAIYSENLTKHINTLCGRNAEMLNVKASGTHDYHLALKFQLGCSITLKNIFHFEC
jgi:hypothetical protein